MKKIEFQVPAYLLLSDVANGAISRKKMARIAIEDSDQNGRLDLKSESVSLNGVTLNERQTKDLFLRLGIKRAQGSDLEFAKKFFGRLSLISQKVNRGEFGTVENVDNALVRDERDFLRPHAFGIETPCAFYGKIKEAAYDVARRRVRLEKALGRLEAMLEGSDPRYWEYSRGLKAGMKACGMHEQIARLMDLDRKAWCDPKLKDCAS